MGYVDDDFQFITINVGEEPTIPWELIAVGIAGLAVFAVLMR